MTTFKDQIARFLITRQDRAVENILNISNVKGKVPNDALRSMVTAMIRDAAILGFENGVDAFKELSVKVQKKEEL